MISDALIDLPAALEADVAIAGAGPAGIVLALELARLGRQVLLVEGGGQDGPGDGASIYDNSTSGRSYPLDGSRLRWLGGTSNHWGGWVRPFDDRDFEDQPTIDLPGWPFSAEALRPYYDRAATWCEVDSSDYRMSSLVSDQRGALMDLSETRFEHRLFRFSPPTRFGNRYRAALRESEQVDCRVNLNLVELLQTSDIIRGARAVTLQGQECEIRANHFVIAMGGVENPRFLLNQDQIPGNHSDYVGRCFMDHFGFPPGSLQADANMPYPRGQMSEDDVMVVIAPRELSPNSCFTLTPSRPDEVLPPDFWSNPVIGNAEGSNYRLGMINAPTPHPESRITLSDATDALGMRRLHLHWHLPEAEFGPVLSLYQHLVSDLSAAGQARFHWTRKNAPGLSDHVGVGYHHMGTTRMAASQDHGVVDPDCRIWDRDNLYVLGSSLFPTAGFANPTLTITALASRLADHLNNRLGP